MLRLQLPGLAGFCLGGLLLIAGLGQGKKWARPGLYAFALLAMGQLVHGELRSESHRAEELLHLSASRAGRIQGPARNLSLPVAGQPVAISPMPRDLQSFVNFQSIPAANGPFGDWRKESSSRGCNSTPAPCIIAWREALTSTRSARCPPFSTMSRYTSTRTDVGLLALQLPARPHQCEVHPSPHTRWIRPSPGLIGDVFNGSTVPEPLV